MTEEAEDMFHLSKEKEKKNPEEQNVLHAIFL